MALVNTEYSNYREVVFYRRGWFWLLAMLLLTPVGILIGLTGDVYRNKDGQVMLVPKASRLVLSIGFLAIIFIKFVGPVIIKH